LIKTLYILIGLKGGGKTYTGKLIEKNLHIPFLRVENIFLSIKKDRHYLDKDYIQEGYTETEKQVKECFKTSDILIMETTGTADEFWEMINNLKKEAAVKFIKIQTSPELCIQRVLNRENKDHVNVSDNDVKMINELAGKVVCDYDLVIENEDGADEIILKEFKRLFCVR
jgi:shikimate kinase